MLVMTDADPLFLGTAAPSLPALSSFVGLGLGLRASISPFVGPKTSSALLSVSLSL